MFVCADCLSEDHKNNTKFELAVFVRSFGRCEKCKLDKPCFDVHYRKAPLKSLTFKSVSLAYDILTTLSEVDGDDWLIESRYADKLDEMAKELGYKSAFELSMEQNPDEQTD